MFLFQIRHIWREGSKKCNFMFTPAVSKQQKLANICKWQIVHTLAHPQPQTNNMEKLFARLKRSKSTHTQMRTFREKSNFYGRWAHEIGEACLMPIFSLSLYVCVRSLKEIESEIWPSDDWMKEMEKRNAKWKTKWIEEIEWKELCKEKSKWKMNSLRNFSTSFCSQRKIHEYNGERFAILMKTKPTTTDCKSEMKSSGTEWMRKKETNNRKK